MHRVARSSPRCRATRSCSRAWASSRPSSRAISAAIVGEFLVADRGLGYYIEQSRQTVDPVGVFAGIVLVTVLVMLCDIVLGWLQRRSFRWQHAATLF